MTMSAVSITECTIAASPGRGTHRHLLGLPSPDDALAWGYRRLPNRRMPRLMASFPGLGVCWRAQVRPAGNRRYLRGRGARHARPGRTGAGVPAPGHGLAVAHLHGQHRGRIRSGLLRHPADRTAAVVQLPQAAARYRHLWRPVDVLHHAGGDPGDDQRPRVGPGGGLRGGQHRGRVCGHPAGHGHGPAGPGTAMSILVWTGVVLIGGAGSVLRFLADGLVGSAAGRDFPLGTLAVNISGAILLGLITGLALGHGEALLAGTAAVVSYTTFSTWMLETQRLAEERQTRKAVANVVVSLVLGVAAAALGRLIGAHL